MELREAPSTIVERIQDHAGVATVYGTPIEHGEKKIVPVAKVAYGFGWGYGSEGGETEETEDDVPGSGEGGGMGGGVRASPAGVVEITDGDTRFIPFLDAKKRLVLVGLGLFLGYLLGRK
jgi:uncharacterized spore protein YtfJ